MKSGMAMSKTHAVAGALAKKDRDAIDKAGLAAGRKEPTRFM
jgi:hypothetical protein